MDSVQLKDLNSAWAVTKKVNYWRNSKGESLFMLITKARHTTERFNVSNVLQGPLSTCKLVVKPRNCLFILACLQGLCLPSGRRLSEALLLWAISLCHCLHVPETSTSLPEGASQLFVCPTTQEIRCPWVMWVFFLAVGPAIHCLQYILSCLVISIRSLWPPRPGTGRLIWWQKMVIWDSVTPIIKRPHYSHLYLF